MSTTTRRRGVGADLARLDGPAKVTGSAPYAAEHRFAEPAAHLVPILSTIPRGRVTRVHADEALGTPGVLAVITHENAPALAGTRDRERAILQDDAVGFRGQIIGAVVAESLELAREVAASHVVVAYEEEAFTVELSKDHEELYAPKNVNAGFPTDTSEGDVEAGLRNARTTVDAEYRTPIEHQNPMEPHTSVACWSPDGTLRLYESTQSVHGTRSTLARLFGFDADAIHVTAPYVGGGFGSKGQLHANTVLAVMGAMAVPGRAVKFALTRQQMVAIGGHRPATIQRLRLGADGDGRLTAIAHDVWETSSRTKEYAEQTGAATRMMYATPNRSTSHRIVGLDMPVPTWMRAPGEAPGMYALESAMDELAHAAGIDPIELRLRNIPEHDPESGKPWSTHGLAECLRTGAERFGWAAGGGGADPGTRVSADGRRHVGIGVASATYPRYAMPGSQATIEVLDDGRLAVRIGAMDIGTGTWTALTQIAAEALSVDVDEIALEIGDTSLPASNVPGGSAGITSWSQVIYAVARRFRSRFGSSPSPGDACTGGVEEDDDAKDRFSMNAFGAHFAEAHVDVVTGEVRVPRMLGVFACGRIVNPRTARSQLIGGMTMGLSMALFEEGFMDVGLGSIVTDDLADYHIAGHADVLDVDAIWIDEHDPHYNPVGAKGIGEIGIVGSAAAVANAVFHATGVRVRDLPITPDKLLCQPRRDVVT